jgi:hypothetical protein
MRKGSFRVNEGAKQTVRYRPNFGHCTETNTVIGAAAAFRRPPPLSERPQLGRERTDWSSLVKALRCHSGVDPAFEQQVFRVPQA